MSCPCQPTEKIGASKVVRRLPNTLYPLHLGTWWGHIHYTGMTWMFWGPFNLLAKAHTHTKKNNNTHTHIHTKTRTPPIFSSRSFGRVKSDTSGRGPRNPPKPPWGPRLFGHHPSALRTHLDLVRGVPGIQALCLPACLSFCLYIYIYMCVCSLSVINAHICIVTY